MKLRKEYIKAAGCFMIYNDRFLLLRRNPQTPQGDERGLVGGGIDPLFPETSLSKKIKEEIGIEVDHGRLNFLGEYELNYPDMAVDFYVYSYRLDTIIVPNLKLESNYDHKRVTIGEACGMRKDLMIGLSELLKKPDLLDKLEKGS